MRKSKENTDVDLTVPLNPSDHMNDDPCFGKLWDPQDNNCAVCSAIDVCGIIYQETIKQKKETFEDTHGPTLDTAKLPSVDFQYIAEVVSRLIDQGQEVTLDDLITTVASQGNIKDRGTVLEYLRREMPKYNMTINNNKIFIHEKGTDNHQDSGKITE